MGHVPIDFPIDFPIDVHRCSSPSIELFTVFTVASSHDFHRCSSMFYILDGCEILHLHQKDARTLYNYITILNHYYPLHFLGTSSCPTQLLRFFNLLRPKGLGSTWDQLPRKSPKPTAKWGSDDLPLLAPIHALVDVAEKVHLKGLKKRGLINQALKYIPSEMNQIYQF